ncbi:MAG: PIN domain-containing protein [Bryobacteraceae bacterium]|nr:PIN domain-containing protein [Bryobacteraceae bacterium]
MALIVDSGAIVSIYSHSEIWHEAFVRVVSEERLRVIPASNLSEIDYVLAAKVDRAARDAFLDDIRREVFAIEPPTMADFSRIAQLLADYADLDLGLADASVVATAERIGTERILTTDLRNFRVVRSKWGRPFRLLPWDEEHSH